MKKPQPGHSAPTADELAAIAAEQQRASAGETDQAQGDQAAESVLTTNAGLHEDAMNVAIDGLVATADAAVLNSATLIADVRNAMLDIFKHRPKPWSQLSAAEQSDVAKALEFAAKSLVRAVVVNVAAGERNPIRARLEGFTDKGGEVKATVKLFDIDEAAILALHKASGKEVVITPADPNAHAQVAKPAAIMPDSPEMEFEAGSDIPLDQRPPAPAGTDFEANLGDAQKRDGDDDEDETDDA